MRHLPLADPGTPDHRSPGRYLWWVASGQMPTVIGGVTFGTIWMVGQSVMPAIIGKAIDEGVEAQDTSRLWFWAGVLLARRDRPGRRRHLPAPVRGANWLIAAYRTVQVVSRHAVRLGATLPRQVSTGEVVSIGSSDLAHVGNSIEVMGRAAGAVVSFFVVAAILLNASVTLGLVVLIGVPALLILLGPLLKPLQQRNMEQREMMGELNTLASDIVGGLRVLRGIGGEEVFHRRYVDESQRVRDAGVQVAKLQSLLDALQVFLPGVFVVIVVWLGARFAVEGQITPGELVAFYGYSAFLMIPLRTGTEVANKLIRGLVAGKRICGVLAVEPEAQDIEHPLASSTDGELVDVQSGSAGAPGLVHRRRGRGAGRVGGTRRPDRPLRRGPGAARRRLAVRPRARVRPAGDRGQRRQRHLVQRAAARRARRTRHRHRRRHPGCDPRRRRPTTSSRRSTTACDARSTSAAAPSPAASASDWCWRGRWPPTPTSWSWSSRRRRSTRTPRRGSPSGCKDHRAGRTTVVTTASPLLLDHADEVALLEARPGGRGRQPPRAAGQPALPPRRRERRGRVKEILPVAEPADVRRYARRIARQHPRELGTAARCCTCSPRSPGSLRRG